MNIEQHLEQELQARGLTAPRITPDHIDQLLKKAQVGFWQPEGTTLTICVIQLPNGFCVTGESAAASLENFQEDIGQELAFKKARVKVWELEGYRLKSELHAMEEATFVVEPESTVAEQLRGNFESVDYGAAAGDLITGEVGTVDCGVKINTVLRGGGV